MDIQYSRIEPVRSGDASTYIKVSIVDAYWTVERVMDWYHDEALLEGSPRIASEVVVIEGENEVFSITPGPIDKLYAQRCRDYRSQT